ncbi:hypothetical protein [Spiroplasma endosymbiont of Amphibalanus improvisus]|uniref:hypothetical protein n=1 Tax=Spiroplasma endosymbiont of Amphibalanus improvisus TaxID=3066327 RepID=UPI00313DAA53
MGKNKSKKKSDINDSINIPEANYNYNQNQQVYGQPQQSIVQQPYAYGQPQQSIVQQPYAYVQTTPTETVKNPVQVHQIIKAKKRGKPGWALFWILIILVATGLSLTLFFTLKPDKFVLPSDLFVESNFTDTTYYGGGINEQRGFQSHVEEYARDNINTYMQEETGDKNFELKAEDLAFNWSEVNFNTPGKYSVHVTSTSLVKNNYVFPDLFVIVDENGRLDISNIYLSDITEVSPYVTTDYGTYQSKVKSDYIDFLAWHGCSSSDVSFAFSSDAYSDHLDLTLSQQDGGSSDLNSHIKITANPNSTKVTGSKDYKIDPTAYALDETLNQLQPESMRTPYTETFGDVFLSDDSTGHSYDDTNYFDLTGVDSADTGRLNHDIKQTIQDNIQYMSDNKIFCPNLPQPHYYKDLFDWKELPRHGSESSDYNADSTSYWSMQGQSNVWQGETWTNYYRIYVRTDYSGIFRAGSNAVIAVTFHIPDY